MTLKKVVLLSETGRFLSCYEIAKLKNSVFCIKKTVQRAQKSTLYRDWRSIRDLNSGCATNALSHFESSITWIFPYFSLFCFALHRLFSSFTLVFDTSNYIVLNVARGCLGNIWATLVFWATLFGAKQENSKNYTKIEDLAIFQSKSFFFFRRIFR